MQELILIWTILKKTTTTAAYCFKTVKSCVWHKKKKPKKPTHVYIQNLVKAGKIKKSKGM